MLPINTALLSRRQLLAGTLATVASGGLLADTKVQVQSKSSPFVLVHGAWHGGWCWRRVADRLTALGLRPGGDNGSFLQPFVLSTASAVGPGSELERIGASPARLDAGRDWMPHGGSLTGDVTAEVVFVGYGVAEPERGHDDYAGVDVKDKLALALEGAPPDLPDARSSRLEKLMAARRSGAAGILLVAKDSLPALAGTGVPVRLVSGSVTRMAADRLLAPTGKTIDQLAAGVAAAASAGKT